MPVGAGMLAAGVLLPGLLFTEGTAAGLQTTSSDPAVATHVVPGVLPGLALATKQGPAPAGRQMTIGVSLQRPDAVAEHRFYQALYDPSSPLYHHFLTPAQFDAAFGVPVNQVQSVERWLRAGGLVVDTTPGAGNYLTATGTVAELDRLLHIRIDAYRFHGKSFVANASAPSVPDDLPVAAVIGLDTVRKFSLDTLTTAGLSSAAESARSTATRVVAGATRSIDPRTGASTTSGKSTTTRLGSSSRSAISSLTATPAASGARAVVRPTVDGARKARIGAVQAGGVQGVLTPQDLWGVYQDPGAHDPSITPQSGPHAGVSDPTALEHTRIDFGQGQTMGIFGDGETSSVVAQLRLFEKAMGLPKVPVRVVETQGGPNSAYGDNTGSIEWYLDSQASTGMAPDVSQLDFYFAKSLYDADVLAAFSAWANDPHGPRQMNASFGECEENPTNPVTGPLAQQPYGSELGDELEQAGNPILEQATIEGRTLFTAAGDTGSGCPALVAPVVGAGNGVAIQPVPMVNYPCASQYAVCVGGTVVSVKGSSYPASSQRASESSWTFSGGGSSYFIPEPSYQAPVANIDHPCLSTPTGDPYDPLHAPTCRGVPDVADMSGNVTGDGYFIYIDAEPSSEGGTSLASPLMMGQWTRVQAGAARAVQGAGGLGFANPTIYRQAASADKCSLTDTAPCTSAPYVHEFTDITQSEYGVGNGLYQPGPGWNYASGWGALQVANFTDAVDAQPTAGGSPLAGVPYHTATPAPGMCASGPAVLPPEKAAEKVTEAVMTGPRGDATDPIDVQLGNDPSLNITRATLKASSKTVVATLHGPRLGALPPPDATDGSTYYVAWLYHGEVFFADAQESPLGMWSFTSGNTGTYGDSGSYGYNDTPNSKATGTVDSATGTITIDVPASEVGSPPSGSLLSVPQAFDQILVGTPVVSLAETVDSSDNLLPVSKDCGASVSRGESVVVSAP